MKRRPVQSVRIFNIQDRTSNPKTRSPWVVRWRVDGQDVSKAFRTQALADRFRSRLLVAQQDGEHFDVRTGLPESWLPRGSDVQLHAWARDWVAEQWPEWAPRTRAGDVYSLARFVPLLHDPAAPPPPDGLRGYLCDSLRPDAEIDSTHECERWLDRWCLTLGDLDKAFLAKVDQRLGVGDEDQALARATVGRYRRVARSCIRRAVELEKIPADPWPPTQRGRSRRKVNRSKQAIDIRVLPGPDAMVAILDRHRSHQPGSRTYQAMSAVTYYAGLRPSETVMLRPRALYLPGEGWGHVQVVEADDGWDEPTEPKTGNRTVPIPPRLVTLLIDWVAQNNIGPNELMFRTRNGNRPTQSNWARALKRACRTSGHRTMRVYDLRHAAATSWLQAGLALGEAARRLGHSVETLVSTYVGALQGDETAGNALLDVWLASTRERIVMVAPDDGAV